jgi:hypothetical protein
MARKIKVEDTKAVVEIPDKIINVKDYAVKNGLLDNSDKPGTILKALNAIDREFGIIDVWGLGENVFVRIRGEF